MIKQSSILAFSTTSQVRKSEQVVEAARIRGEQTAFLSHSHKDAKLAKGVQGFLQDKGWEVYIDWEDTSMPSRPNKETANKIKEKIRNLDWFIYLATANSASSRWCPWEIGYADGSKKTDSILIFPTKDSSGHNYGNEYLNLYRHIDIAEGGGHGLFETNNRGILLEKVRYL